MRFKPSSQAERQIQQRSSGYAAVTKAQAAWWREQIDRVRKPSRAGAAR
jgi:hypothetical protein